ncbi:MAG: hypothetical protein Q8N26_10030 [Myxococcales bacterium]|nr:hypothetical protein [Myxococcales bacterium]
MMTRSVMWLVVLWSVWARAQVSTVGDVIVVPDATGSIHQRVMGFGFPGLTPAQGLACQDASRAALGVLADEYDFLVVFLSEQVTGPSNVPLFQQARLTAQNIGQNPLLNDGAPFGSRAKLKGCVFMGSALRLPLDPDAFVGDLGSGPIGMTAIEVVGHEVGHMWLVGADYDLGGGRQEDLRSGDRHYNPRVDSRSVMFGGCIDPVGAGLFRVSSCPRKYNSMDQYFMGLVPPADVQPLLLVSGQGSNDPSLPLPPTAAPVTIMGSERRVGIDAVIRHMGQRAPAFPATQRCFRTGFLYVARTAPTPEALLKVDAYRRRFESWFTWASDGHGFVDTRAVGTGCLVPVPDAGVPIDAGTTVVDAGATPDGGVELTAPDAGMGQPPERIENQQLRPGCGCSSVDTSFVLVALAWFSRHSRRRAPR